MKREFAQAIINRITQYKGFPEAIIHNKGVLEKHEPTLILTNLSRGASPIYIKQAIDKEIEHDIDAIIPINLFFDSSTLEKKLGLTLFNWAGIFNVGEKLESKGKYPKELLGMYSQLLKQHSLIVPITGNISYDGNIAPDTGDKPLFDNSTIKKLNYMMDWKLNVQFLREIYDPITDKHHIVLSKIYEGNKAPHHIKGLKEASTVISAYQLKCLLNKHHEIKSPLLKVLKNIDSKYVIPGVSGENLDSSGFEDFNTLVEDYNYDDSDSRLNMFGQVEKEDYPHIKDSQYQINQVSHFEKEICEALDSIYKLRTILR